MSQGRIENTPMLDKWLKRLERALSRDGARHSLLRYISRLNGQPARQVSNRLSEIIHRRRLPHVEITLTINSWLKRRK